MVRSFAMLLLVSCLAAPAFAQNQPAQASSPAATSKSVGKKSPPGPKPPKQATATETGPCAIGVIAAIGDHFSVQHVGLTVFGNELIEVPIEPWGIDDLVVTRVRAAAGGSTAVHRIVYAKGAFDRYYHPPSQLFSKPDNDLPTIVRTITASSHCDRYLVVTKSSGQYGGTNQTMDGLGVVTNSSSGMFNTGALFAYVQVTVFDGQSFAIREDPLGTVGARLAASLSKDDSIQQLKDFEPPATPEATINNARLRDGARALLSAKLDRILPAYLNEGSKTQ